MNEEIPKSTDGVFQSTHAEVAIEQIQDHERFADVDAAFKELPAPAMLSILDDFMASLGENRSRPMESAGIMFQAKRDMYLLVRGYTEKQIQNPKLIKHVETLFRAMVASHMREALSDDVTPAFESLFRELAREERIALEHCFLHFDLSNKHNAELSAKAALTNKATDTAPPQSAEVPTAQPNETTPTIAEPPYDQAAVNHYLTLRTQLLERAQLDPQKVAYQNAFDNAVKASGNAFVRGEYTG